jgi:uncharacterized membrane protein HdeD (DUF308 family)
MSSGFPYFLSPVGAEVHDLRRKWGWFVALGIALIVVGLLAMTFPIMATVATVTFLSILLLLGAGAQIASAIWARRWGGFFLHLLYGLLYLVVGALLLERPVVGAAGLTLLMSVLFTAGGLFRIAAALSHRFSGWGWTLVNGIITLILGFLIWRELPEAALWVIGLFVGIDLLFIGWSWVMLGLAVRQAPVQTSP